MSVDLQSMKETELNLTGRHDPCIVPKAVPVVEAMVSIVLVDFMIRSGRISRDIEVISIWKKREKNTQEN